MIADGGEAPAPVTGSGVPAGRRTKAPSTGLRPSTVRSGQFTGSVLALPGLKRRVLHRQHADLRKRIASRSDATRSACTTTSDPPDVRCGPRPHRGRGPWCIVRRRGECHRPFRALIPAGNPGTPILERCPTGTDRPQDATRTSGAPARSPAVTPDRNVASHSERAQTPLSRSTSGDPIAARYIETDVHSEFRTTDPHDRRPRRPVPRRPPRLRRALHGPPRCGRRADRAHARRLPAEGQLPRGGGARRPRARARRVLRGGVRRRLHRPSPSRPRTTDPHPRPGRTAPRADTRLGRMGRITRSSLHRFDRYTLDVFNAGSPYGRTER